MDTSAVFLGPVDLLTNCGALDVVIIGSMGLFGSSSNMAPRSWTVRMHEETQLDERKIRPATATHHLTNSKQALKILIPASTFLQPLPDLKLPVNILDQFSTTTTTPVNFPWIDITSRHSTDKGKKKSSKMSSIQLSFSLRVSSGIKTVHLLGSWDNYVGQLPLSKDRTSSKSGSWKGIFKFQGSTLEPGQRYWYYYIIDGYHVAHNPSVAFTVEPTTGRSLNILDVPSDGKSSKSSSKSSSQKTSSRHQSSSKEKERSREHRSSRSTRTSSLSVDIPKGRPLSISQIKAPKPMSPHATRHILDADYCDEEALEELTARFGSAGFDEEDIITDFSNSPVSSTGSSLSYRSDSSSPSSSLSGYSTPSSDCSSCTCERYGITRKGERVKIDCGGERCGYGDDTSSCSSATSDSEEDGEEYEAAPRKPVAATSRRNGIVVLGSWHARWGRLASWISQPSPFGVAIEAALVPQVGRCCDPAAPFGSVSAVDGTPIWRGAKPATRPPDDATTFVSFVDSPRITTELFCVAHASPFTLVLSTPLTCLDDQTHLKLNRSHTAGLPRDEDLRPGLGQDDIGKCPSKPVRIHKGRRVNGPTGIVLKMSILECFDQKLDCTFHRAQRTVKINFYVEGQQPRLGENYNVTAPALSGVKLASQPKSQEHLSWKGNTNDRVLSPPISLKTSKLAGQEETYYWHCLPPLLPLTSNVGQANYHLNLEADAKI
ncbi:hypothetical protein SODALDRAFT_361401 [Sodiomyces alkalinus F11]|uniref:AMP-activated protein kinase glycogen-binding domain-containing protein n=1 Tax=Sodiomyces alkalinus (strain CBS 110278 / VKM F-3762 / F11) TaxID=1314773 RepID=A0A3N2PTC5_SODAK|nr:hypothetical protein SODALDRAFT_361401 [Sodiomyces alkalinus F11]ROT37674.1 hypothetical protein SODALDRAFT_361401 [Sodiomyces alkalinus F11]